MDRDFTITPILINHQPLPNKTSWVKIFMYEPVEPDVLETRGKMYAVLSVSSAVEVDFTQIMQLILDQLQQHYFQQTEGGILQTLESALDEIHKKLLLTAQQDKRLSMGFSFNLLTAVSWGTVLYFGQLGSSRACLWRHGHLYDIDEGEQKTTTLYLSSGVLQPDDRILLGTTELVGHFNRQELKELLQLPSDQLAKSVEGQLDTAPAGAMQSGMVLFVEIKQVPSMEEEGLHILDPDTSTQPKTARPALKWRLKRWFDRPTDLLQRLFRWRIAGRLPGLPLIIVLLALALLGGSVYAAIHNAAHPKPSVDVTNLVKQTTTQIQQAQSLATVNPDRALDVLAQAHTNIQQGLHDAPQNHDLLQLQQRYQSLNDQLLDIHHLGNVQTITTLALQPAQPKLIVFNNQLFALDTQKNDLIAISPNGTTHTFSVNHQSSTVNSLLSANDQNLILTTGHTLALLNASGQTQATTTLPDTLQPTSLAGYHQNAYALDPAAGQIYRFTSSDNKIASPTTYLAQPSPASDLKDLAIDGSIYTLDPHNGVTAYLNGQTQSLSLEQPSLAKTAKAIFTNENTTNLYLLGTNNLLMWTKDGKYQGQYQLANGADWQMVGIDFTTKTLYIFSDGKLLKAALPQ